MTRIIIALIALTALVFVRSASAQHICDEGVMKAFVMICGSTGAAPPPVTCNGAIDLSTGCAMPMLGGM